MKWLLFVLVWVCFALSAHCQPNVVRPGYENSYTRRNQSQRTLVRGNMNSFVLIPVINSISNALGAVAMTREDRKYLGELRAVDLVNRAEKTGSPVINIGQP
jgi:hypothetical protein